MKLNSAESEEVMCELANAVIGFEAKCLTSRIDYSQDEDDSSETMLFKTRVCETEHSEPWQESEDEDYEDAVLTFITARDASMHLDTFT